MTEAYGKSSWLKWVLIYLLIAAVLYGLIYWFITARKGNNGGLYGANGGQPSTSLQTTVIPSPTIPANAQKISVSGSEFAFTPDKINLKKGETAAITFTNNGKFPHNLTIPKLQMGTKTVDPGQSDTLVFTAQTSGSFDFLCTVPGHADKGMKGTLTIR